MDKDGTRQHQLRLQNRRQRPLRRSRHRVHPSSRRVRQVRVHSRDSRLRPHAEGKQFRKQDPVERHRCAGNSKCRERHGAARRTERFVVAAGSGGSAARSASDRYPGSQPVDMKDAAIPDVGIPVSNQVYSTSDSLTTVMAITSNCIRMPRSWRSADRTLSRWIGQGRRR